MVRQKDKPNSGGGGSKPPWGPKGGQPAPGGGREGGGRPTPGGMPHG